MKNTLFLFLLICSIAGARVPAQSTGGRHPEEDSRCRADMEKQLEELRFRSGRRIDESVRQKLNLKLREIRSNRGATDVFPGIFRLEDINRVANNEGLQGGGASLEGLRFFHQQLAERDIDLIVLPVVSQVVLHAHKLVPGKIQPGDDIWPAYTQILIDLLEDGIEIIDVRPAFEAHLARNPDDDPLNLVDHHWSSTGRTIGARLAAERLQRYAFIREAASGRSRFSEKTVTAPTALTYLQTNAIPRDRVPALNIPETITQTQIIYNGAPLDTTDGLRDRIDPLLILGDSQALYRPGERGNQIAGTNFAEHLSREVGFPVPHRAENGGANFMPRRYAERWILEPKQPRVIVMVMVMDQLLREWAAIPFPAAKGDAVAASAKLVGTDETTLGDWKGKYGAEGHFIVGQEPQLPPALLLKGSPQVIPTINVPSSQVYLDSESHLHVRETTFPKWIQGPHCLLLPSAGSKERNTTVWRHHFANDQNRAFAVDVNFQDENEHQVALYIALLAETPGDAWTTIEVQNANPANRKTLVSAERIEYGDKGVYAIYRVKGRVRFLVRDGLPALAGLFFDKVPGAAQSGPAGPDVAPAPPADGESFIMDGRIEFVSKIPDPKTSPYVDALTTVVFRTDRPFPGTGESRAYVIGWAFRDRELVEISRFREGENWRLKLVEWEEAVRENPRLESVQRIDGTDFDPDMPVFWTTSGQPLR